MLGPLPEEDDTLDYLIAIGEATPARSDLLDLPPPKPAPPGAPSSEEIFEDLRADRF
jgi:hypothetical protein